MWGKDSTLHTHLLWGKGVRGGTHRQGYTTHVLSGALVLIADAAVRRDVPDNALGKVVRQRHLDAPGE